MSSQPAACASPPGASAVALGLGLEALGEGPIRSDACGGRTFDLRDLGTLRPLLAHNGGIGLLHLEVVIPLGAQLVKLLLLVPRIKHALEDDAEQARRAPREDGPCCSEYV
jgi:hypothetical protein